MTRRTLLGLLLGGWVRPANRTFARALNRAEQRYRADAVIQIFSIPIYRRLGVGSGYAWLKRRKRVARKTFPWDLPEAPGRSGPSD